MFGAPGRRAVELRLPSLREELAIDFCIVNGENAAAGRGITAKLADRLLASGAEIGPEAIRLQSDILWAARRWREAAEQIELLYGERWRDFTPLNDAERTDIACKLQGRGQHMRQRAALIRDRIDIEKHRATDVPLRVFFRRSGRSHRRHSV